MLKMTIATSVWSAQHPSAGWNVQHMLKLQIGAGIHCKNPLLTFLLKILSKVLLKPKPKRVLRWKTSPILGSILLNFFGINFFNINVMQGEIQIVEFIFLYFLCQNLLFRTDPWPKNLAKLWGSWISNLESLLLYFTSLDTKILLSILWLSSEKLCNQLAPFN